MILLTTIRLLLFAMFCFMIAGCSSKVNHEIKVRNQSFENGIVILEPSFFRRGSVYSSPALSPIFPLPGNGVVLGRLTEEITHLPDNLDVVWQLADLSNCSQVLIRDYYPGHTQRYGCTFTPKPEKIFRKTIDFRPIKESKEGRKAGKISVWSFVPGGSIRYVLTVTLIFVDDELKVDWGLRETNPWL